MDEVGTNEQVNEEEVQEQWLTLTIPLSDDEFGTPEENERWQKLQDQIDEVLEGSAIAEVDGNEIGEGEFMIWMITTDPEKAMELISPVVEAANIPESAVFEVRDVSDEDYDTGAMRMTLLIPLSNDGEGTEAERAKYESIAKSIDEYLKQAELGEVDTVYFGEGEGIISSIVTDGVAAGEGLQEILSGEELPEDTKIQIESADDEDDEDEDEESDAPESKN